MQARSPLGDVESAKLVGLPHRIAEFDANGWIMAEGDRVTHCHLLCEIAARQEDAGICQGPDYEWPMTQEQIGDATGLTSVHVNRTLQQLRSEGYFRTTRRRVTVNDWRRLWEIGDLGSSGLPFADALQR